MKKNSEGMHTEEKTLKIEICSDAAIDLDKLIEGSLEEIARAYVKYDLKIEPFNSPYPVVLERMGPYMETMRKYLYITSITITSKNHVSKEIKVNLLYGRPPVIGIIWEIPPTFAILPALLYVINVDDARKILRKLGRVKLRKEERRLGTYIVKEQITQGVVYPHKLFKGTANLSERLEKIVPYIALMAYVFMNTVKEYRKGEEKKLLRDVYNTASRVMKTLEEEINRVSLPQQTTDISYIQ